jgi:hypothetical protein
MERALNLRQGYSDLERMLLQRTAFIGGHHIQSCPKVHSIAQDPNKATRFRQPLICCAEYAWWDET